MQHQTLIVFLKSEAGSDNKRDKTKSYKHQSHEGVQSLVRSTDI